MDSSEMKKVYEQIGKTIRTARQKRGLTLEELAGKCGRDWSYLSQIERARSVPSIETLKRICEVLKIPMSNLFSIHKPVEYRHDPLTGRIVALLDSTSARDKKVIANYLKHFLKKR